MQLRPPIERVPHWVAPLAAGAAAVAATAVAYAVEPSKTGWLPKCPFHALTGLYCPGCGATRALHELTNGNIVGALHNNALLLCAVPLLIVAWFMWLRNPDPGKRLDVGPKTGIAIAGVFVVFTLARNVPAFPLTLLAPVG